MSNEEYFTKQCEVLEYLLSRKDKSHSAIKTVIRCATREACNFASNLPGYDNKLGAKLISKKAYKQISQGDRTNLIGEHIVPISIILIELNNLKIINFESITKTIKKYSTKAVITKSEDCKLRSDGLQKSMPENWCGNDIMARYKRAGIEVIEKTYKEVLKEFKEIIRSKEKSTLGN